MQTHLFFFSIKKVAVNIQPKVSFQYWILRQFCSKGLKHIWNGGQHSNGIAEHPIFDYRMWVSVALCMHVYQYQSVWVRTCSGGSEARLSHAICPACEGEKLRTTCCLLLTTLRYLVVPHLITLLRVQQQPIAACPQCGSGPSVAGLLTPLPRVLIGGSDSQSTLKFKKPDRTSEGKK